MLLAVAAGAAVASFALAPPFYCGEAIVGRVVDADTGEPIPGAVVVAQWQLFRGGIGHGGHRDSLLIQETTTDGEGGFRLTGWGPKLRPLTGSLDTAPHIVVIRRRYFHESRWNEHGSNSFERRSDWNGKTIALKGFSGSRKRRIDELRSLLLIDPPPRLMLVEILKERDIYGNHTFFDHVESLLAEPESRDK